MISVEEVVVDPDLASAFTVQRTTGAWQKGKFVTGTPTTLQFYGAVQPSSDRELDMLPEGDRAKASITAWCDQQIYTTQTTGMTDTNPRISDVLVWQGDTYRVISAKPWGASGYWRAVALRMAGE